jgi:predicted transcriptional regulator
MKKLIFSLFLASLTVFSLYSQTGVQLAVGMKAPDWKFKDADSKEFTMNTWSGKVLQVNYVDPDEQDMNEAFNDAVKKAKDVEKRLDEKTFKGFGIVDCKSTWKPDWLIRKIAGNKAKKFNTTILFDYDGTLQNLWGLPKDSYSIAIIDKQRVCRALFKGKMNESDYEKTIKLIVQLSKE